MTSFELRRSQITDRIRELRDARGQCVREAAIQVERQQFLDTEIALMKQWLEDLEREETEANRPVV